MWLLFCSDIFAREVCRSGEHIQETMEQFVSIENISVYTYDFALFWFFLTSGYNTWIAY